MNCLTIKRGDDGLGSQFFSIISGIIYCLKHNIPYSHTQLNNIKLIVKDTNQNTELDRANELINKFVENLNINSNMYGCLEKPFCHDIIYDNGSDFYYTDDILDKLKKSYKTDKPNFYQHNKLNIAIHIRRGNDIPLDENSVYGNQWEKNFNERWVNSEIYDDLISKLLLIYPNSLIHIFSWNNPKLKVSSDRLVYHIVNSGDKFVDDFNSLVSADILIVGSSTFSISAGFLNPNVVICSENLCKLPKTPIPPQWIKNYKEIIGE